MSAPRRARLERTTAVVAAAVLAALGLAYFLTYEPAPRVGVAWHDGLSAERQRALERRFLLVNRSQAGDRFRYDLLDTRAANIRALLDDPDVADTESISRSDASLPPDISYGDRWMWVRHRLPLLRRTGVVEALMAVCVTMLGAVCWREWRERPGPNSSRSCG